MACLYRDERINRIFEGTNEINRLIIGCTLLKKSILEELPIRDMIAKRDLDWFADLNIPETDPLIAEACAVEYARSFTLLCLHESILKYGQDFKNEQWIIEPMANMVIALSIMDTGYKRYLQLDDGDHKNETRDVLMLSIADKIDILRKSGMDIIIQLFTGKELEEKQKLINTWYDKTKFSPNRIECQKKIANTLYMHKKYYLD